MEYMHLLVISFFVNFAYGTIPTSSSGPSGSSFHITNSWPGYQIAGFVDLNADRNMDVLLVDAKGGQISASIAPKTKFAFKFAYSQVAEPLPDPVPLFNPNLAAPIRSVVAADFNGDSIVDLLILTSKDELKGPFEAHMAYGSMNAEQISFTNPKLLNTFTRQPITCDLNSDLVTDIYGETTTGERIAYFGGPNFTHVSEKYTGPKWADRSYSLFADVDGNFFPDLLILVEDNAQYKLQFMPRDGTSVSQVPDTSNAVLIEFPDDIPKSTSTNLGLFVLNDFDRDGEVELLVMAHLSSGADEFHLYRFGKKKWERVNMNLIPVGVSTFGKYKWSLAKTPSITSSNGLTIGAIVGPSVGDVNLDGYPDVGLALTYYDASSGTKLGSVPAILVNLGPGSTGQLSFRAHLYAGVDIPKDQVDVRQIGFFDHAGIGWLDTFTVSVNNGGLPTTQLLSQSMTNDYYFLKVTVLNGLCQTPRLCPSNRLPYGLPVSGIRTSFRSEDADGNKQMSIGLLGSQSCCGALQLPFVVYGLGPFANFVESLSVSIPSTKEHLRSIAIRALVPNSEVFVNPYPHDVPDNWSTKLFLQPLYNMKVVYIAIALLSVCLVLIVIISVLQYLEVREDRSERQLESQRFHFDAM